MTNSAAASVQHDPLFRSAHDALRFAFMFSGQQYPMTIMAKMMRGIVGNGKGLIGLDGALQAGLICRMVKDMTYQQQAAIEARYADQSDKRWQPAIARLTQDSVGVLSGLSHRYARHALIARYFGARVNIGEVAEKCGVRRETVSRYQRPLRDFLRKIEDSAYDQITVVMRERGVIE